MNTLRLALDSLRGRRRDDAPPLPPREPLGITCVLISDTHGHHRKLTIPPGDVLIHAGDFTAFGREEHARDFNAWLGTLPHKHKIVVFGNHESNAEWSKRTAELLSNATFLCNEEVSLPFGERMLRVHGTDFFWPM